MSKRALSAPQAAIVRAALERAAIAPEPVCARAIARARLVRVPRARLAGFGPRGLIAAIALRRRAQGITLGALIYLREDCFDERGAIEDRLLVHEIAHVVQYERDGAARFLAKYIGEYAAALARGSTDREAYLGISYEVEARRLETLLA